MPVVIFDANNSWTVPEGADLNNIVFEYWGAGGGGGGGWDDGGGPAITKGGGGGAGGSYMLATLAPGRLPAGTILQFQIGVGGPGGVSATSPTISANSGTVGGDTYEASGALPISSYYAQGGQGASGGNSAGVGLGGTGSTSNTKGDVVFKGGNGAIGRVSGVQGGGAGSSAGSAANGNNGSSSTGGAAPYEGGKGGAGGATPTIGSAPGGGGGGPNQVLGVSGQAGANGRVRITYQVGDTGSSNRWLLHGSFYPGPGPVIPGAPWSTPSYPFGNPPKPPVTSNTSYAPAIVGPPNTRAPWFRIFSDTRFPAPVPGTSQRYQPPYIIGPPDNRAPWFKTLPPPTIPNPLPIVLPGPVQRPVIIGPPIIGAPWFSLTTAAYPPPPPPPPAPGVVRYAPLFVIGPPMVGAPWFGLAIGGIPPSVLATTSSFPQVPSQPKILIPRVPDAEARLRSHTDKIAEIANSLISQGLLVKSGGSSWTLQLGVMTFNGRGGAITLTTADVLTALHFTPVPDFRNIIAGPGLQGSGNLASDVTLSLPTLGTAGSVTLASITVDSFGRVTSATSGTAVASFNTRTGAVTLSAADVTTALGYTPVATLFTGTASVTVGNTGVETSLMPVGVGSLTLAANFLTVGKTVRFKAKGYLSTALAPGNLTFNFKVGGTTAVSTAAFAAVGSLTNQAWDLEVELTCRTTGVGGTSFVQGRVMYEVAAVGSDLAGMVNTAADTIDTTITEAIDLTVTWGTADPANTITLTNASLESLN